MCTADTNLGLLPDSVASFVGLLSNYCDVCLFLCCHLVPWVLIFLMSSIIYSFRNRAGFVITKTFYLGGFIYASYYSYCTVQCALNAKETSKS